MSGIVTSFDHRTGRKIMDESGPNTPPPVMPSPVEGAGGTMQRTLDRKIDTIGQLAHLYRFLNAYMKDHGLTEMKVSTFTTDLQPMAKMVREGNYHVAKFTSLGS